MRNGFFYRKYKKKNNCIKNIFSIRIILVSNMKVSWIKFKNDKKSFKLPENLGFDVFSLSNEDDVDNKIDELISNKYNTIIVSNEIAGFSEKINKDYLYNKKVKIIISKDTDKPLQ